MTADHAEPDDVTATDVVIHNKVIGSISGLVVQTGSITGGLHVHLPDGRVPPRQLPPAPPGFAGREHELAVLTSALDSASAQGGTVVISALSGTGGIGKTWLALHWAHQNIDRFPDGQLFVDLHGFAPTGRPMTSATAVRGFLDALGVDPKRIPVDLDAQVGMLRSHLAGRRMLLVLDNARSTSQVASLLPGTSTCTVLVTSRDRLSGLIDAYGARPLLVDVLSEREACDLLTARLGGERLAAQPEALAELLSLCAGLPLALGIVAGRAEVHRQFPLSALVAELRDTRTRLEAFDDGDPAASLAAVLSWSYQALPAEQARIFRLLGVVPGQDISLPAAANLIDLPPERARHALRALERVSLLRQDTPGRYRMHDLVRLYAADLAAPEDDHPAALRRLIDFYVHTACAGDKLLDPYRQPIESLPARPGFSPQHLEGQTAVKQWFETEHACLLAARQAAGGQGWHQTVWRLAWCLTTFHRRRGHVHDNVETWQAGLAAADELSNPACQVLAHRLLGDAMARVARGTEALEHLGLALDLSTRTGDLRGQAHTHTTFAETYGRQGEDQRALEHANRARRLYETFDSPVWLAMSLNQVGWYSARLGHYDAARKSCEKALSLQRHHHERGGEAATLDSLGFIAHRIGDYPRALDYYRQALRLYAELGASYEEANTLDRCGQTELALGRADEARTMWQQALDLYQVQQRPVDVDRVNQRLSELSPDGGTLLSANDIHQ